MIIYIVLRRLQGVKRSVDNYKMSPYTTAEIIAVKVPRVACYSDHGLCCAIFFFRAVESSRLFKMLFCA